VVGDRSRRIILATELKETVAMVWVIGDRAAARCYEDTRRRVEAVAETQPRAAGPAAVMLRP